MSDHAKIDPARIDETRKALAELGLESVLVPENYAALFGPPERKIPVGEITDMMRVCASESDLSRRAASLSRMVSWGDTVLERALILSVKDSSTAGDLVQSKLAPRVYQPAGSLQPPPGPPKSRKRIERPMPNLFHSLAQDE